MCVDSSFLNKLLCRQPPSKDASLPITTALLLGMSHWGRNPGPDPLLATGPTSSFYLEVPQNKLESVAGKDIWVFLMDPLQTPMDGHLFYLMYSYNIDNLPT
ncbi:hypothetical protein CHARACLAT_003302 [Characodon lateralis]|uniref:Uncharacterized protein n=1 Tax=Characodon lateralis TaxID=208331 RepID=A0ABU7CKL1_9TELE|nr:hypothetical protein [Characodon lateralis]